MPINYFTRGELPGALQGADKSNFKQGIGDICRTNAIAADLNNDWMRPSVFGPLPWIPGWYYTIGQIVAVGGNMFIAVLPGASSSLNPPTYAATGLPYTLEIPNLNYSNATLTLGSGGTGYNIGDILTISSAASSITPYIIQIAAVTGNVITRFSILQIGVYTVTNPGTMTVIAHSGTGTGATFTTSTGTQVEWSYLGPNIVTNDPGSNIYQKAWSTSLPVTGYSYVAREAQLVSNNNVFAVVVPGTTNSSTAPVPGPGLITDGTAKLVWLGVYRQSPWAQSAQSYTYQWNIAPPSRTNTYSPDQFPTGAPAVVLSAYSAAICNGYRIGDQITFATGTGSAFSSAVVQVSYVGIGAIPTLTFGGTGYAPGDALYLSGGKFNVPVVLTVATTGSNGSIATLGFVNTGQYTVPPLTFGVGSTSGNGVGATFSLSANNWGPSGALTVINGGQYVLLPANTTNGQIASATTTGSGTGAAFYAQFTEPWWCRIIGGYHSGAYVAGETFIYTHQQQPFTQPNYSQVAFEFVTDTTSMYFTLNQSQGDPGINISVCDPLTKQWVRLLADRVTNPIGYGGGNYNNYYSFTFPAGIKRVRFNIQTKGFLPTIHVPANFGIWKPSTTNLKAVLISDSLVVGSGQGPFQSGNCMCLRTGQILGLDISNFAEGGTGLTLGNYLVGGTGSASTFQQRLIEAKLRNPDIWIIMGSLNDKASTSSAIQAAELKLLTAIRSFSQAPICRIGNWPANLAGGLTTIPNVEVAVQTAVAQFGGASQGVYFVPVSLESPPPFFGSWNNPSPSGLYLPNSNSQLSYMSTDLTHPIDRGTELECEWIANQIKRYFFNLLP